MFGGNNLRPVLGSKINSHSEANWMVNCLPSILSGRSLNCPDVLGGARRLRSVEVPLIRALSRVSRPRVSRVWTVSERVSGVEFGTIVRYSGRMPRFKPCPLRSCNWVANSEEQEILLSPIFQIRS